jgi:hypothetical protein
MALLVESWRVLFAIVLQEDSCWVALASLVKVWVRD